MELLNEDTFSQLANFLSNLSKVEDLPQIKLKHDGSPIEQKIHVSLTLLLVLNVLFKGSHIALVGCESGKRSKFLAVFSVLDCTQLENRAINILNLLKSLRFFLFDFAHELYQSLENDALELSKKLVGLESLARNVERKVIS